MTTRSRSASIAAVVLAGGLAAASSSACGVGVGASFENSSATTLVDDGAGDASDTTEPSATSTEPTPTKETTESSPAATRPSDPNQESTHTKETLPTQTRPKDTRPKATEPERTQPPDTQAKTTEPPTEVKDIVYNDPEGRFSMTIGSNWTIDEDFDEETSDGLKTAWLVEDFEGTSQLSLITVETDETSLPSEQLVVDAHAESLNEDELFELVDSGVVTAANGNELGYTVAQWSDMENPPTTYSYFEVKNGQLAVVQIIHMLVDGEAGFVASLNEYAQTIQLP